MDSLAFTRADEHQALSPADIYKILNRESKTKHKLAFLSTSLIPRDNFLPQN